MHRWGRITIDPEIMGGKPCIRGLRLTVDTIMGLLEVGRTAEEVLNAYPYIESEDIDEVLAFAATQDANDSSQDTVLRYSMKQATRTAKENGY